MACKHSFNISSGCFSPHDSCFFSLKSEGYFSSEMSISSLDLLKESAGKFRINFLMSKMQIEEGGVLKSFRMTFLQKAKFSLK